PIVLPPAGTADSPVALFYNSLSKEDTEYGYGWTGLYRQRVESGTSKAWLSALENHAGATWRLTRCGDARVKTITDPFDQRTTFNYDTSQKLSGVVDSGGRSTDVRVNATGDLDLVTWPDSTETQLVYGKGHLLTAWVSPDEGRTTYAYDACRRVTRVTSP